MNKKSIKTIALLCLPSVVFAILSNRRPQDKRPIKFFLPYEKVRLNMLAQHGETEACRAFGPQIVKPLGRGIRGFIRAWLPFGLVLWLDKGAHFSATSNPTVHEPSTQAANASVIPTDLDKRLNELEQSLDQRQDRLETLLLRILVSMNRPA